MTLDALSLSECNWHAGPKVEPAQIPGQWHLFNRASPLSESRYGIEGEQNRNF